MCTLTPCPYILFWNKWLVVSILKISGETLGIHQMSKLIPSFIGTKNNILLGEKLPPLPNVSSQNRYTLHIILFDHLMEIEIK